MVSTTTTTYQADLIDVIAEGMEFACNINYMHSQQKQNQDIFESVDVPDITLPKYIRRLYQYTGCSSVSLVTAVVYIDMLVKSTMYRLTHTNIHRVFLACLLLAVKFHEDLHINNKMFAQVGGVTLKFLNNAEVEMLYRLQYNLNIHQDHYQLFFMKIQDLLDLNV